MPSALPFLALPLTMPRLRFRFAIGRSLSCLLAAGLWMATVWAAPGDAKRLFDLPVDTADKSLKRFSEQSGLEVFYPSRETRGLRTRSVKGEMTAREALDAMLAGTGLTVVQDERTGAFSVRKNDPNG